MKTAEILNRALAYNNIDGVGELGGGFMMICASLLMWEQAHSPAGSVWHSMVLFAIYWSAMCAVIHYGSKAIKERITFPRTGFVEYRRQGRWRSAIVAAVVSSLVGVAVLLAARWHWKMTTPGALIGLLVAASYGWGIARRVPWKWVVAGAMVLGSLFMAPLTAQSWEGAFLRTFALYGILLLISGGITLVLYLRQNPAPQGQA